MKKLIGILALGLTCAQAATLSKPSNFIFADLLVWQAREGGADNWAQIITSPGAQRYVQPIDAPFPWQSGFRLGMGHRFCPRTALTLIYTHFNTTATNQAAGDVYSAFDANYFANNTNGANFGPFYSNANIHWQIAYNTVDLNAGYRLNQQQALQIDGYIGLKTAWINQSIKTNWFNPRTSTDFTMATENLKNDFWGLGPSIGADSNWQLFQCGSQSIDLIGNIGLGLLWGQWRFSDVYRNDSPVTINTHVSNVYGLSPVLSGLLGAQWHIHFAQGDFSIRLGYEEQVWFNQVQLYSLDMGRTNRSLSLQGGNLEFKYVC